MFLARLANSQRRCVAATTSCCCCCCPSCEGGLDQRPAPADPVAVASIHKLVSATRKPTLGGILARRQPRDESWNIKVSEQHPQRVSVSMRSFLSSFDWPGIGRGTGVTTIPELLPACLEVAYLGMMRSGASRMARQPSAQKAYAPCASAPGCADIPPSNV